MTLPRPSLRAHDRDWATALCLIAFIALTAALATQHEMWRDEVNAFTIATRASSWSELLHDIHEEGHPILWYAILRIGYAATHSVLVLPIASVVIAAGAAFLMLRFAPFPFWIRVLAVFGAFLGYEYSVNCRNYGIGILLMLAACTLFPTRHQHPLRLGAALALLSNTSVPATIAGLALTFVWMMDFIHPADRRALLTRGTIVAICIAIAGAAFALWSANPPPEIVYSINPARLNAENVLRVIFSNPGRALMGVHRASIAAGEQLPWESIGLNPTLPSVLIVDVALLSIAWSLRRNLACLIALVLALFGFETLFRLLYTARLRHEGMLAFTAISLCWIAASEALRRGMPARARSIALGLIPLLVTQSAALIWMAKNEIERPVASSKSFATFIRANPRFQNAILAGEPDYMMQAMPYYVPNRIFLPSQGSFDYRIHFDRGTRRKWNMRLGALVTVADSLACSNHQPVLLGLAGAGPVSDSTEKGSAGLSSHDFPWSPEEKQKLFARGRLVFSSFGTITGEDFNVFEISPSNCR